MFISYDNINNYNNNFYNNILNTLPKQDIDKINKILKPKDKKLSILSRYLLINILSQNYNINYNNLNIKYNKYNKPIINNLYFNISHSHDYSVVVTSNNPIGVDIEKIRKVNLNIINYFCTNKEKKYILNSENIYKNLFEIYCLKEAYIKMLGTNLSNIKNIEFIIKDNTISCPQNKNINIIINYDINNYIIAIIEKEKI